MEEIKFRLRNGELKLLKKAKGKMTWRELFLGSVLDLEPKRDKPGRKPKKK